MSLVLAQEAANETYLMWGFILVAVAFLLVVMELFVPSGGIIGAVAAVAAVGSIAAFFMHDMVTGLLSLGLYIVLTPIVLWAMFKFWVHSPMARHMVLGGVDSLQDLGDGDPTAAAERARMERLNEMRALIGAEGVTITALRPVGTVRIEGQRIDALAESGTIDARTPVVVTDVYDNQIKVRPI